MRGPVRAILFDVYGTLFISGSGGIGTAVFPASTINRIGDLLASHGFPHSPESLVNALFDTIRAEHARKREDGIDFPEVEIDRIWTKILEIRNIEEVRRFALAFELIVNPIHPMPHLDLLLSSCAQAGLAMGIISNAQFYTPLLFDHFRGAFPEQLGFDPGLIIYSYRCGHAKPSPMLFSAAAERLGELRIETGSALFVGNDMRNDILAAREAGFQTALFAGDQRSLRLRTDDPRCCGLNPDLRVTDLHQLVEMMNIS